MKHVTVNKASTFVITLLLLFFCNEAKSQVLSNHKAVEFIRQGITHIYKMEFEEAAAVGDSVSHLFPGHPVNILYRGMMIYWQNFPIIPSSPEHILFEEEMNRCRELTETENIPGPDYEAEYLLANLSARGLLLLFYSDNKVSSEVIPLATQTYRPLINSFRYTGECPDLYFFAGLYNYYRDAYPRIRPIYRAVAFLFPPGNMNAGIKYLETCAREAMALHAEAYSMLAWIRMHFENDYQKSLPYCRILYEHYPANPYFKGLYIKNLLLLNRYDEAEKIIRQPSVADTNEYYRAQLYFFNGLMQEKKYKNFIRARELYRQAINSMLVYGEYGKEFQSYAYFGLSRISPKDDQKQERRIYRRKAMELTDFKKITFDE